MGFCFDPDFAGNGYLYVFVTVSSSEQQIQRYQGRGNGATNKFVLLSGLPTAGNNHDGGSIAIGPDGNLYWGIGDNGNGTGVNGNLTSLAAKIGRARLDGSVPALNPFNDGPVGPNQDYIFARGVRNPFKCAFQPATGLLWVNVVGTSYEQSFVVQKGDHAGYDTYENNQPAGYITPRIKYRTNGSDTRNVTSCSRANNVATFTASSAHGFRVGERIILAGVADNSFNTSVYVDSTPTATTFTAAQTGPGATSSGGTAKTAQLGGCLTGGCFYDSTAFPAEYWGNYFFCDYNSGQIIRATFGGSNGVDTVDPFVTGLANAIDATVGPDGALYYGGHGGEIRRLSFTNTQQKLIVAPAHLNMAEGGTGAFQGSLAVAPTAGVSVNVAFASGSRGLSTTTLNLSFTPANYSVPQTVYIRALGDSNGSPSRAVFTVSAAGMPSQPLEVNAYDATEPMAHFTSVTRPGGVTTLAVTVEPQVNVSLEASTTLKDWRPIATNSTGPTNSAVFSDTASLSNRFYRARIVP